MEKTCIVILEGDKYICVADIEGDQIEDLNVYIVRRDGAKIKINHTVVVNDAFEKVVEYHGLPSQREMDRRCGF